MTTPIPGASGAGVTGTSEVTNPTPALPADGDEVVPGPLNAMASRDPTSAPNPLNQAGPVAGNLGVSSASSTGSELRSKTEMDKDLFLKLLVAQLKYQDPTKPADSTQFLAQTAQFTMVEKIEEANEAQQQLLTAQLMTSATTLVGRTVAFSLPDGSEGSGVVTAATISGSSPTVKVGNTDVPLSSVKEVRVATP